MKTMTNIMHFYLLNAVAILIITATGCSNVEPTELTSGDENVVIFNIEMPVSEFSTRAEISNNEKPTILQWSVYEVETDENNVVVSSELLGDYSDANAFASGTTFSLSMTLAKGRKYQVTFFAKNIKNTAVTYENGIMKIDYYDPYAVSNNCSAYTARSGVLSKDGKSEVKVTLTRKMAMVGWFCADLAASSLRNDELALKVNYSLKFNTPLFSSYNLLTEKYGDQVDGPEYTNQPLFNGKTPADNNYITYKEDKFYYVCYNFILTDASTSSKTIDMELKFSHPDIEEYDITVTSNSIPVRQNYKTRIFGRFLTNNEIFGITMDRNFYDNNQSNEL